MELWAGILQNASARWRCVGRGCTLKRMATRFGKLGVVSAAIAGAWVAACTGAIGDVGGEGAELREPPTTPAAEASRVSAAPFRRLSRFELDASLRSLLGDTTGSALAIRDTPSKDAYETLADDLTWDADRNQVFETAVFDAALKSHSAGKLLGCTMSAAGDSCFSDFIKSFGARVFRRALSAAEVEGYVSLQRTLESRTDDVELRIPREEAVARVVSAMFLSPSFMYLTSFGTQERGAPEGVLRLTPSEYAARLSFAVWGSPPDDALMKAASDGDLDDPTKLRARVLLMLKDPRAGQAAGRFVLEWLDATKLPALSRNVPGWSPDTGRMLLAETSTYVSNWAGQEKPSFSQLFSSDHTFVNDALASYYGMPAQTGPEFTRVSGMAALGRGGLLTQGSFLASHAIESGPAPTVRGKWFVYRVLCGAIGESPPDALTRAPKVTSGQTNREWHEAIAATPGCGGCHAQTDPLGFAFEAFDQGGRARPTDQGKAVNTRSEAPAYASKKGFESFAPQFSGASELSSRVGASESAAACFGKQWIRYAMGRQTSEADGALAEDMGKKLLVDQREAMIALVTSPAFQAATTKDQK